MREKERTIVSAFSPFSSSKGRIIINVHIGSNWLMFVPLFTRHELFGYIKTEN